MSLLPPGSEQAGNTNLMQEIESFDSPYQQQEGKNIKLDKYLRSLLNICIYFPDQESPEKDQVVDAELFAESDIDLSDEVDDIEELRDEVLSVYEQIRNLVVNLKRSKPSAVSVSHKGQSLPGASLHTSIASSESSEHSGVQFQVSKVFPRLD